MASQSSQFTAVDHLSDSDIEPPTAKAKPVSKRRAGKQKAGPPTLAINDVGRIRAMLGNPKCHCKNQCLSQFVGAKEFEELKKFRDEWSALHKTDQDIVELRLLSTDLCTVFLTSASWGFVAVLLFVLLLLLLLCILVLCSLVLVFFFSVGRCCSWWGGFRYHVRVDCGCQCHCSETFFRVTDRIRMCCGCCCHAVVVVVVMQLW